MSSSVLSSSEYSILNSFYSKSKFCHVSLGSSYVLHSGFSLFEMKKIYLPVTKYSHLRIQ